MFLHRRHKLVDEPVERALIRQYWPVLLGLASVIGFNLLDIWFVAQLGSESLSALGFLFPVLGVAMNLTTGLGIGTGSLLAKTLGQARWKEARWIATQSLLFALVVMGGLVLLGYWQWQALFKIMGANPNNLGLIGPYFKVWLLGLLPFALCVVATSLLRAAGAARSSSLLLFLSAGLNATLDPFFIWGFSPWLAPQGFLGAAWASVVSRYITAGVALWLLIKREGLWEQPFWNKPEKLALWRDITAMSLPSAFNAIILPLGMGLATSVVAHYDSQSVAGLGLASKLESFLLIPFLAAGYAISPFVGQNIGAKKPLRILNGLKLMTLGCLMVGFIEALGLQFFSGSITSLFTSNSKISAFVVAYLHLVPWSYGLVGVILLTSNTLNALQKPKITALLTVLRIFGLYWPLILWLDNPLQGLGISGLGAFSVAHAAFWANTLMGVSLLVWQRYQFHRWLYAETSTETETETERLHK